MMTDTQILLQEIDAFIQSCGLAESTFGRKAVNDGKLVARLRNGRRVWPETAERVRAFMRSIPASGNKGRAA